MEMSTGRSGRGRRVGAPAVQATTPASASGRSPANSSGAVPYDDNSPRRFKKVQPIPVASLSSPSQGISAAENNTPAPGQKQQLCLNPKKTYAEIAKTSLPVRPAAAGLVSSSPSPARVELPTPEVADLQKFNYARNYESLGEEFYNFLKANKYYEKQLQGTTSMNKKHGTSDPYAIRVSYKKMLKFNAGRDLIRSTCISVKQNNLYPWLIPAVKRFLHDNGCSNQEPNYGYPCASFSGFPDSTQKLEDFTKNSLVEYVGQIPILATTFHGRLLIQMPMVTILENHSHKYSWNGRFSADDILIIKSSERRGVTTYETYEMKILQKPIELEGQTLFEAMARDLHKAAEIFIPLFKMGGDYPAHFLEFNKALRAEKGFLGEIWFIKHLTHHPAIISPAGRRTFWIKLHRALVDYNKLSPEIMRSESTARPYVWKSIVESEFEAEKLINKDIITVLKKVYRHKNKSGNKYKNTVYGLVKFMRNVLAHGMHDRRELELYLAKMFSSFLPSIMQDLLKSGRMETRYEAAWTAYEVSKLIKIDEVQVQVVTTGGVRTAAKLQLLQIMLNYKIYVSKNQEQH